MVANKKQKVVAGKTDLLKLIKNNATNSSKDKDSLEEKMSKFIRGEMTLAQVQGISMEQAYAMAEMGYQLFLQGKYKEAQTIFDGLIVLNPYDGYFHSVSGSIWARLGQDDKAINEYSIAINLSPKDSQVLVNRAELLLRKGQFEDALNDLKKAIDLNPEGNNSAVARARALVAATVSLIQEMLKNKQEKSPKAASKSKVKK